MNALILIALVLALLWAFTQFYLRGATPRRVSGAIPAQAINEGEPPSAAHAEVLSRLSGLLTAQQQPTDMGARLRALRATMDAFGDDAVLEGIELRPVDVEGMAAEWVMATGSDPSRRLLYLHGGAWAMGSPRSHRCITTALARRTGAAVLVIDYRLMPEHSRLACLEDSLTAYRWMLENGPEGAAIARSVMVGGDSAGGNLTLALLPLVRDAGLRAPDAAFALSPATDGTLSGASLKENLATDAMLGPMFGKLTRVPHWVLLWAMWLKTRLRPCDPRVSPLHAELHSLPPTLIHVSNAEMLLDDALRFVAKARAAGSPVSVETWPHMVHVWHFFEPVLPEAQQALDRIARFIEHIAPRQNPT
jgi:acetyl esterase/lipase